ncbi:glycosyltransferase family 39 protein [Sandaracinus amylolyticus]|uniref:glycosyltransferase family 39 protein n=1 Tax=Sandaracinus amylolyticus TaxID=927083 RepID=UPI001F25798E|nr:glycosyltransferase family 39 protein [Sandaracinus amylolyticus]UJR80784.1 Hypothetical protein I5071_28340 [Sandaracinus amylolyticus]
MRPSRDELRWLVVIVLAAIVLRVAWVLELATFPWWVSPPSDSLVYEDAAMRLASGAMGAGERLPIMSPGYFVLLGGVYRVLGTDPWAPRVLQLVAGAVTVIATWTVARRVVPWRGALVAAALVAFSGPMVFFDGVVLPDSLAACAQIALVWLALRAIERGTVTRWAAVGAMLAALAWLRPNVLLELAVLVPAPFFAPGDASRAARARHATAVLLAAMLALAPLSLGALTGRGADVGGPAALNLFLGNGPGANGAYRVPPEAPGADSPVTQLAGFHRAAERALGRELSPREADRYWTQRTIDHVVAQPDAWLVLMARKVHLFFNAAELGAVFPYDFVRESTRTIGAPLVQTGWIAPFALVGMLVGLFGSRQDPVFVVAAIAATFVLSVIVAFVTDRYRVVIVPVLSVLAVFGVERLARAWGDRRRFGLLGLATVLAIVVAIPVRGDAHFERQWAVLGDAFASSGEPDRAIEAYDRALAIDAELIDARIGRALALAAMGRRDEARAALEAARAIARDEEGRAHVERALEVLSR